MNFDMEPLIEPLPQHDTNSLIPESVLKNDSAYTNDQKICPHGCPKLSFKRQYELKRHLREQHICWYKTCRRDFSTPELQKEHMRTQHGENGLPYKCGSCTRNGDPPKAYKRPEKLKVHFEKEHNQDVWTYLPCTKRPCFLEERECGGTFFFSKSELAKHLERQHGVIPPVDHSPAQKDNGQHISKVSFVNVHSNSLQYSPVQKLCHSYSHLLKDPLAQEMATSACQVRR
jgi:hypothetical protein